MSTSAQVPSGVVSSIQGRASVIPAGESVARPLQAGDVIRPGDVLLADQATQLQITDADGNAWMPRDMQVAMSNAPETPQAQPNSQRVKALLKATKGVDAEIDAVERGDEDAATAVGLAGGGGGSLALGLRVDRVIETVSPQEFAYGTEGREDGGPIAFGGNSLTSEAGNGSPLINDPSNQNFNPASARYNLVTVEEKPVSGQVKATDPDGDPLTFSKGSDPTHGTVEVNPNGTWTYKPNKDYNGDDSFTVTVSDGKGGTATATVAINITPFNDKPEIDDPTYDPVKGSYNLLTDEDKPLSGQVKASDVDIGDKLTFTKESDPKHGTVIVNADGTWTYTPNKNYNGSDSFTVTVSDGHIDGTVTSTINIGVMPVNDAPKIDANDPNYDPEVGQYVATSKDGKPVSGQVKATDVDGDNLTYTPAKQPTNGSVTVNPDGTWVYKPNAGYTGSDTFTVKVDDGHGGTATAKISVGMVDTTAPDAPTIGALTDDVGAVKGDIAQGAVTDDAKPTLSGSAEAGATVQVYDNGKLLGSSVAGADGKWAF
ncbi:MAG: Ig-like domain-containing protein, partial [Aquabacterium sp.]|nr:Ig-like domain-containing protein [Aquabacterium sp.]